ncbi:hypothetical protein BC834DRAFT_870396, partial [Gloeopeniophorella convolvens]
MGGIDAGALYGLGAFHTAHRESCRVCPLSRSLMALSAAGLLDQDPAHSADEREA